MPIDSLGVENGEGSSSAWEILTPESGESSDIDDPVLAHNRDHTLLDDDFLESESQKPSVLT